MFRTFASRVVNSRLAAATATKRTVPVLRSYSTQKPKQGGAPSVPAMLAVASMGFGAYYMIVKSREGQPHPGRQKKESVQKKEETPKEEAKQEKASQMEETMKQEAAKQLETDIPAFKPDEVTVVFVLGGPGAGKGTQCENLKKDYGFVHLSAGDLLRAEQKRPGSKYGELINYYIKEGLIVPMEVTIALLEQAMKEEYKNNNTRFLVDGFPRKMDQAIKFEEVVVPSKMVLYFECPEEVMLKRLLKRGESSGRADDNIESIKKRFRVFKDTSFPVIEAYEKQNKVTTVSCDMPVDQVYQEVKVAFDKMFAKQQ
ncbi:adenylate kinase-domain-containing protein [Radiomyces spectabilis]|uniref:adenylate kinase-domain-containing protein n=1 Tax=Radiomyces spectabilis TaxID=64574 RepID=UPI00221FE64C|nr:adenylate kinase-domain-containing protein [Radiomyces spectabilis]KAI8374441.1 adenylate kinase-domain-containing protein [Radiomyces spectabilis]